MSLLALLILLIIIGILVFVVRSVVAVYKRGTKTPQSRGRFPVFSITLLSISLLLLIVGTTISLQISDALGGAIASIGGFISMFEAHVRHKREALLGEPADKASIGSKVS